MRYPTSKEYSQILQKGNYKIVNHTDLILTLCDETQYGDRSVVFKMHENNQNKDYALKCYLTDTNTEFSKDNDEINVKLANYRAKNYEEYENQSEDLPPYLVPLKYVTLSINSSTYKGNVNAVLMDWIEGQTLKDYMDELNVWIPERLSRHKIVYLRFVQIAADLLDHSFAHGNIDPENIIIQDNNDIKLVDYDNMNFWGINEEESYFKLAGIIGNATKENSDQGFSEEGIEEADYSYYSLSISEEEELNYKCIDSVALLWITINLNFYLRKTRNKKFASFLLGNSETAMLFQCGMDLSTNYSNLIEELILDGERPDMGALFALYFKALQLDEITSGSYVIAALNITESNKRILDNFYQLDSSIIKEIIKKICLKISFTPQELLIYKELLCWDSISSNPNIKWNKDVIEKLKYYINWNLFVKNQKLDFLTNEKKEFLKAGYLWVNKYFESLKTFYYERGKKELEAPNLKQEMIIWFWDFVIENYDIKGDYFYSINSLKPILCKYWISALNYEKWYNRRINKKSFTIPVEFILAFTYYEDDFESEFNVDPHVAVKGNNNDYWDEPESESVDILVNSYLCLDQKVCINYGLIRYWIDQEALDKQCWKSLSANRNFIKSNDIIESFVDYWDWSILCDEKNLPDEIWTIDFLQNYKDKLDWNILSDKNQIGNLIWNEELLNLFAEKWNWYILCNNQSPKLWTMELYKKFKSKWDEQKIKYPIVYNIIKDGNHSSSIKELLEKHNHNFYQSIQFYFSQSFLQGWNINGIKYSIDWSYTLLSLLENKYSVSNFENNPDIFWKLSWLVNFQDKISWEKYDGLCKNPHLPLTPQILDKIREAKIPSLLLCENPLFISNIDLLSKYWDEEVITTLKNKKLESKQQYIGSDIKPSKNDYSFNSISNNNHIEYYSTGCSVPIETIDEALKYSFEKEYKEKGYIDWNKLSDDKLLIWNDKFISEHKEDLNWGIIHWYRKYIGREGDYDDICEFSGLCANPAISWTKERLQLFKDSVVWNVLAARVDIEVPWFCVNEQLRKEWYEKLWKYVFPWMNNYNDINIEEISTRKSIFWEKDDLQAFNWGFEGNNYDYSKEYKIMNLFWENISKATNVNWSICLIQKYLERWNWKSLSNNQAVITKNDILSNFKNNLDWESDTLIKHLLNHWDLLDIYKDLLDWYSLCLCHWNGDELFLSKYATLINWTAISKNQAYNWPIEFMIKYEQFLDWNVLSSNPSVYWNWQLISKFEDKINWDKLVHNKSVQWNKDIIEEYNYLIEFDALYYESQFPWDFVIDSDLYQVDWREISQSPACTDSFIRKYKTKLNWNDLSRNENMLWTIELINDFNNYWNYALLSTNKAIPWSTELIDKYIDQWDWVKLSKNKAIPWDENLVFKYFDKIYLKYLDNHFEICNGIDKLKELDSFYKLFSTCHTTNPYWNSIILLEMSKRDLINYNNLPNELFECNNRNLFDTIEYYSDDEYYDYEDDYRDDWCSIHNNPYYDDNLDMDQQSPEFWDNL